MRSFEPCILVVATHCTEFQIYLQPVRCSSTKTNTRTHQARSQLVVEKMQLSRVKEIAGIDDVECGCSLNATVAPISTDTRPFTALQSNHRL